MPPTYPHRYRANCPICEGEQDFTVWSAHYRDEFLCEGCHAWSIPRERALAVVLKRMFPAWRKLVIHESSPQDRGISAQLSRECAGYLATQFFPGQPLGATVEGFRNENLETQTFADGAFDIVITQDVMEHVNDFPKALLDINRTLRPGGAHIFTTPTYPAPKTVQWAWYRDGQIQWLYEPEYHGNPVDATGSPVTFHYGYDFPDLIEQHCGLAVEVVRLNDVGQGITGPMNEVYVIRQAAPVLNRGL
jgi:SAM-dependent methyltransferase